MIETNFDEVKVMYVRSDSGVRGGEKAFNMLESKLPDLKGRRFYGLIFGIPPDDEYRACAALEEEDDPLAMGLKVGIIPAGKYVQEKIIDWSKNLKKIGEVFRSLSQKYDVDHTRPNIEFYRSMKELLVKVPIN